MTNEILANIGAGLLGWTPIAMLELNDYFAHSRMKTELQEVLEYVNTIWEKDYALIDELICSQSSEFRKECGSTSRCR